MVSFKSETITDSYFSQTILSTSQGITANANPQLTTDTNTSLECLELPQMSHSNTRQQKIVHNTRNERDGVFMVGNNAPWACRISRSREWPTHTEYGRSSDVSVVRKDRQVFRFWFALQTSPYVISVPCKCKFASVGSRSGSSAFCSLRSW